MTTTILIGDCRAEMAKLEPESVHCVVTSPPYWGLRDYGIEPTVWGGDPECAHEFDVELVEGDIRTGLGMAALGARYRGGGHKAGQVPHIKAERGFCTLCNAWRGTFGLEPTYQLYVDHSVEIFRAVKRILRADGTLWLNLGDSYATGAGKVGDHPGGGAQGARWAGRPAAGSTSRAGYERNDAKGRGPPKRADGSEGSTYFGPKSQPNRQPQAGLKSKDLCGIPWRVAFALQADGWYLRRDIIWHKSNPMPESTTDRCTTAHEYVFHLSKSERYYYDADAIKEPASGFSDHDLTGSGYLAPGQTRQNGNRLEGSARTFRGGGAYTQGQSLDNGGDIDRDSHGNEPNPSGTRNKRSVWTVSTKPFPEAHFATFPPGLIEPCILAGTSEHGCCPDCGAGWERITANVATGKTQKMADGWDTGDGGHGTIHREGREKGERGVPVMTSVTLGFYPTCACASAPELPAYPDKPREDHYDTEAMHEIALVAWRSDCALITSERTVLCARAKGFQVKPAAVFDPFFGAGTTGLVAQRLNRNAIGCELNPDYAKMAQARLEADSMTRESRRRHMARVLNKEKPWTAETLFAETGTGNENAQSINGRGRAGGSDSAGAPAERAETIHTQDVDKPGG